MLHPLKKQLRCCEVGFCIIGLLAVLSFSSAPAGQPNSNRQPIPSKEDQAKSQALIDDIFKADFDKATTPEARSKLALYLIGQGRESTDSASNRYVLYMHARKMAAKAGDINLSLRAITALAKQFDVDILNLKADTLVTAVDSVEPGKANSDLVDLALRLLNDAVKDDNYKIAETFGAVAYRAAKKARSVKLVVMVQKRNKEVAALKAGFAKMQVFLDKLAANPNDAKANLELGRYFGLLKNQWKKALPLLAKGADANLKALAQRDLQSADNAQAQVAVADGWWDLARKLDGADSESLRKRAAFWYDKALVNLAGLNRTKAIRRIEQVSFQNPQTTVIGTNLGKSGKIRELKGHTQEVKSLAFSPDGRYAVSASNDTSVRLWDLTKGKEFSQINGHTKEVWSVAFHPGGRQLASASWDATAKIWDFKSGKELKRFTHPVDVNGVAFSRDGKYMLVGCDDKFMQLWDASTGKKIRRFTGPTRFVYGVAFSPDGRYVACGSLDQSARVYDRNTGQTVRVFDQHKNAVYIVAFSRDSRHLFTCGDDAVHQFEIASGKEVRRFVSPSGSYMTGMALSQDGRRLLTGGDDKMVRLWDTVTGKELHKMEGHTDPVSTVAISADGRYALSGGLDRTIILWGLPRK